MLNLSFTLKRLPWPFLIYRIKKISENVEKGKFKKSIHNLDDLKKKSADDNKRKKLMLMKKELWHNERELNKMVHLISFQEFNT